MTIWCVVPFVRLRFFGDTFDNSVQQLINTSQLPSFTLNSMVYSYSGYRRRERLG
jgi:hypothetical protein